MDIRRSSRINSWIRLNFAVLVMVWGSPLRASFSTEKCPFWNDISKYWQYCREDTSVAVFVTSQFECPLLTFNVETKKKTWRLVTPNTWNFLLPFVSQDFACNRKNYNNQKLLKFLQLHTKKTFEWSETYFSISIISSQSKELPRTPSYVK